MVSLYFLCKNLIKGDDLMFTDETLEKFFAHTEMQAIPVGTQSTIINVVEKILQDILEEDPYASLSKLFVSTANEFLSE